MIEVHIEIFLSLSCGPRYIPLWSFNPGPWTAVLDVQLLHPDPIRDSQKPGSAPDPARRERLRRWRYGRDGD